MTQQEPSQSEKETGALLRHGVDLFNRREWFACHEAFETVWRAESAPYRDVYKALVQVAAAMFHAQSGNQHGAWRLLRRARALLQTQGDAGVREARVTLGSLTAWLHELPVADVGSESLPEAGTGASATIDVPHMGAHVMLGLTF